MALIDQSEPDASDLKLMLYRNNLKQALLSARGLIIKSDSFCAKSDSEQTESKVLTSVKETLEQSKLNESATGQEDKSCSPQLVSVETKESLITNKGASQIVRKRKKHRAKVARHLTFETNYLSAQKEEDEKCSRNSTQTKKSGTVPQHIVPDLLNKYQKISQQFACLYCYKTFRSRVSLKLHMDAHNRDTFTRNSRSFALLDKSTYKRKLFLSTGAESSKTLKCNFCRKLFKNHSQLTRHKATQHRKDCHPKKEFSCKKCGKVFATQHRFSVHLMEHGLKFKCGVCDLRFKHPKELFYHKSTHVNDVIQCNICNEVFQNKLKLAKHLQIHNEKKKSACEFCKKTFKLTKDIAHHETTCSLRKCFDCAACGENFASKSELKSHLEHHMQNEDGKKEFTCDICKRTFKFIKHFARHKKWSNCQNLTPEKKISSNYTMDKPSTLLELCVKEPPNNDDEFKCEDIYVTEKLIDCELDELLTPLKASLGENPTVKNGEEVDVRTLKVEPNCIGAGTTNDPSDLCCGVCDEIFVSKEHLHKHQEEHKNLEFQCTECSAVFSTDARRYKHLYQAHYTII